MMKYILPYNKYLFEKYSSKVDFKSAIDVLYRQCKESIEAGDKAGIEDGYKNMRSLGKEILDKLTTTYINRQDLQKKVTRLKKKFDGAILLFRYAMVDGNAKKENQIMELDRLYKGLNDIAKYYETFLEIEEISSTFQYGNFHIRNDHGFKKSEYSVPLKIFDEATSILSKAGFEKILQGSIILTSKPNSNWAGMYAKWHDDTEGVIELNIEYTIHRDFTKVGSYTNTNDIIRDSVYTLVHEFGHKLWFECVSIKDKKTFSASWMKNKTDVYATVYGATKDTEGFAELFAHYLLIPEAVTDKAMYKEGIAIIESYRQ